MKNKKTQTSLNINKPLSVQKILFELIGSFIHTLIFCTIIFSFVAFGVKVNKSSMLPTLHDGDYLFCVKLFYQPQRGDIVIIDTTTSIGKTLVKRVIAKENDSIEIDFKKGLVYVNNSPLIETYINTPTNLKSDWDFPKIVPKGKLFVLGDNRNDSLDSRCSTIGFVDEKAILGKAVCVMFPFNRIGTLK